MAQTIEILQLRHKSFWNHNIMEIHQWTDDLQIGYEDQVRKRASCKYVYYKQSK